MQMAFPSVYQDAEHGIETRFAAGEINADGRDLKILTLNEFGAALSSLHGEANR